MHGKRKLGMAFGAIAIALTAASAAYACASLATLAVDPGRGTAGATVSGTGGNYRVNANPAAPTVSDVFVTLDRRRGPVLATVTPTADRKISFDFTVPDADGGWHTLLATQYNLTNGEVNYNSPVAGTPGRAAFKIRATSGGNLVGPVWSTDPGSGIDAPATLPVGGLPAQLLLLAAIAGVGSIAAIALRSGRDTAHSTH